MACDVLLVYSNGTILCRDNDYEAAWLSMRKIFKTGDSMVELEMFLDKLTENRLIHISKERELKAIKKYFETVDEIFYILIELNPEPAFKNVISILHEMGRGDIITELNNEVGELLYLYVHVEQSMRLNY